MFTTQIMKITYIGKKVDKHGGGSNHSLDLMANSIADLGHDVEIITLHSKKNNLPEDRGYKIIEKKDLPTPSGSAYSVLKILEAHESQTDVFHIFAPGLLTGGGLYKIQGGSVPVVGRLNSYSFCTNYAKMDGKCHKNCSTEKKFIHDVSPISKKILATPYYAFRTYQYPRIVSKIDRCFALSPAVKNIYTSIGVKADTIKVIPNFCNPKFEKSISTDKPISKNEFRLLYIGRLVSQKGIHILLEAIEKINTEKDVKVHIVGDGPEREQLISYSKSLSIEDSVTFHGYIPQDDIHKFYIQANAFVHPSLWPEPFPRTILEALQYDCVPIVSNVGGSPWAVGDAGLVFERENSSELASKIEKIVSDPSLYCDKKLECNNIQNSFSKDIIVPKIESEYYELAD